jgi:hypothetical protein
LLYGRRRHKACFLFAKVIKLGVFINRLLTLTFIPNDV